MYTETASDRLVVCPHYESSDAYGLQTLYITIKQLQFVIAIKTENIKPKKQKNK